MTLFSAPAQRDKPGLVTKGQERHWERGDSEWGWDLRVESPLPPPLQHHTLWCRGCKRNGPLKIPTVQRTKTRGPRNILVALEGNKDKWKKLWSQSLILTWLWNNMEISDQKFELWSQKREKEGGYHSLNSSYVLKVKLGNLSVISLVPHNDLIKQELSPPFYR